MVSYPQRFTFAVIDGILIAMNKETIKEIVDVYQPDVTAKTLAALLNTDYKENTKLEMRTAEIGHTKYILLVQLWRDEAGAEQEKILWSI